MALSQEISIFKNILRFFNKEYKTKIDYNGEAGLVEKLGLENISSVEKALFYAVFSIFQGKGFELDKSVELNSVNQKVEGLAMSSISKSKFHKVKEDYLLIISTKFIEGFDEKGEYRKVSEKNDFAILDYHNKKFYCQSNFVRRRFLDSLLEKNIQIKKQSPKITNSQSFSKIFSTKNLSIYEVEFHKVKDIGIFDLYIKAGSKKTPINKKIKEIVQKIIKNFGAYNLKSLLVSIDGKTKERIRINLIEEDGMGIYKLMISPKKIKQEVKNRLEELFGKNDLQFEAPLKFKDEPIDFTIFSLIKKRKIKGYNSIYKKEIQKWDKNNLLSFDGKKLRASKDNILKTIENYTKKDFNLIKDQQIQVRGKKIKGYILERKSDKNRLFFLLRNSEKDLKNIEGLYLNQQKIPFFYIETKSEIKDYENLCVLFTSLNKNDGKYFTLFFNRILDNPQLYKNLEDNYKWSCDKLKNINQFLSRKSSQKKGEDWELICNSILNYTFRESFPLGRSYLPDGITFFTRANSIIWDSKALNGDKSYLNQSVNTKNRKSVKDTFYIEVFKEKGFAFDYYAYLTCGVDKEDFEKVKKRIGSTLRKKNISIKTICITDKWIKGLTGYLSTRGTLIRIQNHKDDFIDALKLEFEKGYLNSFEKDAFDLIGKSNFNQDLTELRRTIKEKMDSENQEE